MSYRIVRKPVLGEYNTLDFEVIKIKDKDPKKVTPKEQQVIKNKLQVKKDSKKQDKNNKNHKNIELNKTLRNNSIISKKEEYFIVGNFHIKKTQHQSILIHFLVVNLSYLKQFLLHDLDQTKLLYFFYLY